jgi:type I restriction enzyme M protein
MDAGHLADAKKPKIKITDRPSMITKDNLPDLLITLAFDKHDSTYRKTIGTATLEINLTKGEIVYPAGLTVNQKTTCNLSANENFVVLECVHRLLEKGYKPEHIELEPTWKLGHGASGGRADILIRDNAGRPLLIIECKTPGNEFKRAWNKTLQDGDQLFSYAQQISETQFLCLYASDFDEGAASYTSHIVAHRDNQKYLEDKPDLKGFKTATDIKERYAVWRETYKLDYTTKGIFEPNIQPYHIGKDKYSLADLHGISATDQQKKYHEFATILRQHNVSGRENAFDKLINLFLCKLVDETENPKDLKFYWKGVAYDTHFDMLDRLQQLYQAGMGKFLGESITYIDQSAVHNAMRFIKQNPDATQKAVWALFQEQKFFTNNDFSLIDVHNEKLFYQNADVLLKIIQMWQDIRLTNPTGHNQFLGDMFEGFLDQGVKQSEGQYFTPMPICRFILMSLPLETLIKQSATPPKAIDYACGAGHFLNELALQLKPLVAQHKQADMVEYHKALYGIEKEYRLSKVAKVSAFMYGQQDINICYGDALINQHSTFPEIRDQSFDLLVANPPYSVKGFLEMLTEAERAAYALTATIDKLDTNNSIETFFIERAKQLLKAGGVAAIILPSSILSNGNGTYIKTREILLQYFDIVAIAEFGSGTFGKTGTNTVTLFLRRKQTAPDTAEHYRERVAEWIASDKNQPIYQDEHLIDRYAAHIGIPAADYKTLLQGDAHGPWCQADYFDDYTKAFNDSAEIKKLYTQKGFKALSEAAQNQEIDKRYLAFVHGIERDKLYHFVMASDQPNPVLIIKGPTENKAQKAFLGYDWSSAKGDEGIKLTKNTHGHHVTPLYDESDRANSEKLNRCVADNFDCRLTAIPAALSDFASTARLVDMLNFTRVIFEKQITLTPFKTELLKSKFPLLKLGEIADVLIGGTPTRSNHDYFTGDNLWVSIAEMKGQAISSTKERITNDAVKASNVKLIPAGTTLLSFKLSIGKTAIAGCDLYTNEAIAGLIPKKGDQLLNTYLFQIFNARLIDLSGTGFKAFGKSLNSTFLKEEVQVPLPPLAIQQQIVTECEAVDQEISAAQTSMANALATVDRKIEAIYASNFSLKKLDEICEIKRGRFTHRPRNEPRFFGGKYPFIQTGDVVKAVASKVPYTQTLNDEGLAVSKLFQPPVVLVTIAANIGDTAVLDYPACFTDSVVGLTPRPGINARFLELMMRAQKKHLNKIAPQMAQKNINVEILKPVRVPIPSQTEQILFVTEIETFEHAIAEAQAIIAAAPARKQAIMQRYL